MEEFPLQNISWDPDFSNSHGGIKSIYKWDLSVEDLPWFEEAITRSKITPLNVEFKDGTVVKVIISKMNSEKELATQKEANKRCEEFSIKHLRIVGEHSEDKENYLITEYQELMVPLSQIDYPIKAMFKYDLENIIPVINKLHDAGIFHGDLEPLNIGLADDGIYIYDFTNSKIYPPREVPEEEKFRDLQQFTDKIMRTASSNRTHSNKITFDEIKEVIESLGLDKFVPYLFK